MDPTSPRAATMASRPAVWNRGGGLLSGMSFVPNRPHGLGIDQPVGNSARHLPARRGLVAAFHEVAGACHSNCGVDGLFEIVRVVFSIAEVHSIAAGAHLAQAEPEVSRD